MSDGTNLTVVIPALNEAKNLAALLPQLKDVLSELAIDYEILVVTNELDPATRKAATLCGTQAIEQRERGYGGALIAGFAAAKGTYVLTMDADLSHRPDFIKDLWKARKKAEITIASRYVKGGSAVMPSTRYLLSRVLNAFFSIGLSLPFSDMSSGFRLYKAAVLKDSVFKSRNFAILQEILVYAFAQGWKAQEIPFTYVPRKYGSSNARVFRFGIDYLKTFGRLWSLRNSILSADYDDRAYDSRIALQRYWQRSRFRHITELTMGEGPVLDVGCGSSRIIEALPPGSVAVDILLAKLRYARRFSQVLVQGSVFHLPFVDEAFPCVICSQVIEHVPKEQSVLEELCRVLAPGGRLVLGTPDYARWEWVVTEKLYGLAAPGGYADEHISHYNRDELLKWFSARGFTHEATRYILRGELIMAFRKTESTNASFSASAGAS